MEITVVKKIPSFLILILVFSIPYHVFGQTQVLDQKVIVKQGPQTLEQLLKDLQEQTSITFSYSDDLIPLSQPVSVPAGPSTLDRALTTALIGTDVEFVVRKNLIILKKKETKEAPPIRHTISGTVRDQTTGETLIGANVYLSDLKTGVITNGYGFYSLTLPPKDYLVTYSYIGFKPIEVQVGLTANHQFNIELAPDIAQLQEIVIVPEAEKDRNVSSLVMSAHRLDINTVGDLPYLYGEVDVVRGIKFLPGVTTVGEGSAGFNVRGGSIDQNLILLDEAPPYLAGTLPLYNSTFFIAS